MSCWCWCWPRAVPSLRVPDVNSLTKAGRTQGVQCHHNRLLHVYLGCWPTWLVSHLSGVWIVTPFCLCGSRLAMAGSDLLVTNWFTAQCKPWSRWEPLGAHCKVCLYWIKTKKFDFLKGHQCIATVWQIEYCFKIDNRTNIPKYIKKTQKVETSLRHTLAMFMERERYNTTSVC